MDQQANIEIVKQCYDAFIKGDIPRLMSYVESDIAWETPSVSGVPFGGKRHGSDEVAEFFQLVNDAQTAREFAPKEYIAQGDRVVALGHYAWTLKGSGATFESDWTHIFTVRNGKVTAFREFLDSHEAAIAYQSQQPGVTRGEGQQADSGRSSVH